MTRSNEESSYVLASLISYMESDPTETHSSADIIYLVELCAKEFRDILIENEYWDARR